MNDFYSEQCVVFYKFVDVKYLYVSKLKSAVFPSKMVQLQSKVVQNGNIQIKCMYL